MNPQETREILITGCSSGIGLCVARGLRARGYTVFATARKPEDAQWLRDEGLGGYQLNLDDSDSIQQAVEQVLEQTGGRLYALFNNGAYGQPGAVEDLPRRALREQFETNVFGWLELTNRVIPVMRAQGYGRILQNSSVLGIVALPYRGAYNASKFAIEGFSDTLRMELHGSGVHVSLIEPGPILSEFRNNAHAAYRKHIDPTGSVHRDAYAAMEKRLASEHAATPFTLPPEAVLKRVVHALEARRPKVRYPVTVPTYVFAWLKRVLPHRGLDAAIRKLHRA
ncbi:MAG: SDR family oxidoreductase [Gammaproteobacteria bacterium]|nr:SDR family oxidoreductase [Gammaproteobacteria bacterium]